MMFRIVVSGMSVIWLGSGMAGEGVISIILCIDINH